MTLHEYLDAQRINGGPHGFEGIGVEKMADVWRAAQDDARAKCADHCESRADSLGSDVGARIARLCARGIRNGQS